MYCMKCGQEVPEETAFCRDCLAVMEKYPVQAGTVVQIPRRKEPQSIKKVPKRHMPTAEEQVIQLRKWILYLSVLLVISIVAIVLMFKPTVYYLMEDHYEIGQNYSSVTPSAGNTAPSNGD